MKESKVWLAPWHERYTLNLVIFYNIDPCDGIVLEPCHVYIVLDSMHDIDQRGLGHHHVLWSSMHIKSPPYIMYGIKV